MALGAHSGDPLFEASLLSLGYREETLLSGGARSQIWRATHISTGQEVALKRIAIRDGNTKSEIELHRRITHPHIVQLRDVHYVDDAVILVMDFASGGDLATRIKERGPLSADKVAHMTAALASALVATHEQGICHHDLSPSNVLLGEEERPLLADLGTARVIGSQESSLEGTQGFMAPELFIHQPYTRAADVYGLAAVGVFALTGEIVDPLQVDTWAKRMREENVPRALIDALLEGLAPDPVRRSSAQELLLAMKTAMQSMEASPAQVLGAHLRQPQPARSRFVTRSVTPIDRDEPFVDTSSAPGWWKRINLQQVVGGVVSLALVVSIVFAWDVFTRTQQQNDSASLSSDYSKKDSLGHELPERTPGDAQNVSRQTWNRMLNEFDARRREAFERANLTRLQDIYVAGSNLLRIDEEQLKELREENVSARGLRHDIEVLNVLRAVDDEITLHIRDRFREYTIVDRAGSVVRSSPEGESKELLVQLRHTAAGWRIANISE